MPDPTASLLIPAPAHTIYDIIADYHSGHPRILPKPPFESLTVETGGRGAGTEIHVTMRVMGRRQSFRAVVTEPVPGRALVETNDTGYVTTFTVEPRPGGGAHVTITTALGQGGGPLRALERWLVGRMLVPLFRKELALLAQVAMEAPTP